jgi:hypothetical protein
VHELLLEIRNLCIPRTCKKTLLVKLIGGQEENVEN